MVYIVFEIDLLVKYKSVFEKENLDIEIKWVCDLIGIMMVKLLVEKDNLCVEVVWGLVGFLMVFFKD